MKYVTGKTHVHGHTLDVVITRENSSILSDIPSIQDPHLCDNKGKPSGDHLAISSQINIAKPPKQRKTVTFRKYRDIVVKDLITDLNNSAVLCNPEGSSDELVKVYNSEVQIIIDKHAPLQTKDILLRPNTQWYTDELHSAKRERRKAERQMRKTNLEVHKQIYRDKSVQSNILLLKCKNEYFSNKILEIGNDQKQLHKLTNNLMGNKAETVLPSHQDEHALSNRFGEFFVGKIDTIRNNLSNSNKTSTEVDNALEADIKSNKGSGYFIALKCYFTGLIIKIRIEI
ncbi:unnamed protein product [Mytilus edulis]|uniref:Uncharacterized protein n=1 Tax=Mytilus edulis TaxID=6550 RepID=A0A8S3TRW1_MYTED|nr:unnamed protein product [Mytilus edulis]